MQRMFKEKSRKQIAQYILENIDTTSGEFSDGTNIDEEETDKKNVDKNISSGRVVIYLKGSIEPWEGRFAFFGRSKDYLQSNIDNPPVYNMFFEQLAKATITAAKALSYNNVGIAYYEPTEASEPVDGYEDMVRYYAEEESESICEVISDILDKVITDMRKWITEQIMMEKPSVKKSTTGIVGVGLDKDDIDTDTEDTDTEDVDSEDTDTEDAAMEDTNTDIDDTDTDDADIEDVDNKELK